MASFTVHRWPDLAHGLAETRRVTRGQIVILTCLPDAVQRFWLNDYAPKVLANEARRYSSPDTISAALGERVRVEPVPIPFNRRDGFNEAYYGRPKTQLDPGARQANSAWSFVPAGLAASYVGALSKTLSFGKWDAAHGSLRNLPRL